MAGIVVAGERFVTREPTAITLLKKSDSGFTAIDDASSKYLLDITSSSVTFHHRTIIKDMSNIPIVTVKSKGIGNDSWVGKRGNKKELKCSNVLFKASASKHKRPIIDIDSTDLELHARVVSLRPNIFSFASNSINFATMNMQIGLDGKVEAMNIHLEKHVDYVFVSSIAVIISKVYKDIAKEGAQKIGGAEAVGNLVDSVVVASLLG